MHRRVWPLLACVVLVVPLVVGAVWLSSGPVADDAWHVEGRVLEVRQMEVPNRFEPLAVARVEVLAVDHLGRGARPAGTIEVVMPEYAPGAGKVHAGDRIDLAVSEYEMHDPGTQETTFEGYLLQDARPGCCWSSRVAQMDDAAWTLLLGVLTVGAVAWGTRLPPTWHALVPLLTGASVGLLAGAWSNESLGVIRSDGEENYDLSVVAVGASLLAWAGLAATSWLSRRRPQAWAFAAGFALLYPLAATVGESYADLDLAVLGCLVPVLAVALGQRHRPWAWVSAGVATALLVPLVALFVMAYQAPYGVDRVAGVVFMAAFGGMFVPAVADGLWAWRAGRARSTVGPQD